MKTRRHERPSRRPPPRVAKSAGVTRDARSTRAPQRPTHHRLTRSSAPQPQAAVATDDSDDVPSESPKGPSRSRHRKRTASAALSTGARASKRARHDLGYYGESSDEDDDPDHGYLSPVSDKDELAVSAVTPIKGRERKGRSKGPTAKSKPSPNKVAPNAKKDDTTDLEPSKIPPWPDLPYLVLCLIFEFAVAVPLNAASASWLLTTSKMCRAFAEPALTALYKCPPLLSISSAHALVDLLSIPSDGTIFNYRQKVEQLNVDVENIVTKTYRGRSFDIKALIQHLPRLKAITLWHQKDNAPYRQLDDNLKWHYSRQLFEGLGIQIGDADIVRGPFAMNETFLSLRSWSWSRRMMGPELKLDSLRDLHQTPCFSELRKVAFINYQLPSLQVNNVDDPEVVERDTSFISRLAESIRVLPSLQHLVIESSTAVNDQLLPLLPKTLRHLELINCWDCKAEDFADYLLSHGHGLRHLTLHHNQSLSLAFLPILGFACPNLESLNMNLTYYNHHEFYRDSDPCYDSLLTSDQVPTWPSTLQYLELRNLRNWDAAAAEIFFQSLVNSAGNLPMLRYLDIKAILNIPFRQRSQMRDKWVAAFKKTFLRRSQDPLQQHALTPLPVRRQSKGTTSKRQVGNPISSGSSPSARRSHRVAKHGLAMSSRGSSRGRDLRAAGSRPTYVEPDTDEDLDEGESSSDEIDEDQPPPSPSAEKISVVQGQCHVVDIVIDNQKPVENQWRMDDFLDSESDDPTDDDWDGDREVDDDYAW